MTTEIEKVGVDRRSVVRVHYPLDEGRLFLRTDEDWDLDLAPVQTSSDGQVFTFLVEVPQHYRYCKPVLKLNGTTHWASGDNDLALADAVRPLDVYPHFLDDAGCSICDLRELAGDAAAGYKYRVFYPPGYDENTLRRYPVVYMQDGQNLFFPDEAFAGDPWRVAETLSTLTAMNAMQPVLVVGVYPNNRLDDYTKPGYAAYGRFLVHRLKPEIDRHFRTRPGPRQTAVMGSSLGGVVSFYLAWQYPETFGVAACMSSTFGWKDDLFRRVAEEPKPPIRLYLDSGWPGDNYEVTRNMRALLERCGFRQGIDLSYLAFPEALHNEKSWALRVHIPFQSFFDRDLSEPLASLR